VLNRGFFISVRLVKFGILKFTVRKQKEQTVTAIEKEAIEALTKVVIFYPGKAQKFRDAMGEKLRYRPKSPLSPEQWKFTCELLHHYRRQVPPEVHRKFCPDKNCQKKMEAQEALSRQLQLF